jgi:tryptophan synthase alpha chain
MNEFDNNRLVRAFGELRGSGRKALLPFLTAGYPDMPTTVGLLEELQRRGVRVCELGIPFSDPIADGPTIQASYTEALSVGLHLEDILAGVRQYREGGGTMALLAMVSYSIVFRHDPAKFCREAATAGFDGLIVPDLPLDEAADFEALARESGLCNVMLIAPTTSQDRRERIAQHSTGFIYLVSVAGITGERTKLPAETVRRVEEIKNLTETPVCVGFGISKPEMVAEVCAAADGAIVGSAIIHRITDARNVSLPNEQLIRRVGDFVGELLEPIS